MQDETRNVKEANVETTLSKQDLPQVPSLPCNVIFCFSALLQLRIFMGRGGCLGWVGVCSQLRLREKLGYLYSFQPSLFFTSLLSSCSPTSLGGGWKSGLHFCFDFICFFIYFQLSLVLRGGGFRPRKN